MSAPIRTGDVVPVPALKGDPLRCSTVLPYLEAYHYQLDRDVEDVYFTEHDLNRKRNCFLHKNCFTHFIAFAEELAKQAAEMAAKIKTASGGSSKKDSSRRKRSRKSVSCISVSKLTSCRPS